MKPKRTIIPIEFKPAVYRGLAKEADALDMSLSAYLRFLVTSHELRKNKPGYLRRAF